MSRPMQLSKSSKCPCGSTLKYSKCCGQYIKQGVKAPTAEALMRSRYTAYVIQNGEYLARTWHQSTRPASLDLGDAMSEWLKLEILKTHVGKAQDTEGTVEFTASFKVGGRRQQLHEVSRFVKEDSCWYYLDGDLDET